MSYTFSLSRRSLPVRCLCLLLAVLVLWCFFMVPRAGAVATEAATVAYAGALIGTILVGAGVVFSSHGDMQAVGAAMYKSWIKSSNAIGSTISAIASWALEHGEAVAKGALRVGKDMYQAVVDAFNASYSDGLFEDGVGYSIVIDCSTGFGFNDRDILISDFNKRHFTTVTFMGEAGLWRFRVVEDKQYPSDNHVYSLYIDCSNGDHDVKERIAAGETASLHFEVNPYSGSRVSVYAWKSDGVTLNSSGGLFYAEGTKSSTLTGLSTIPVTVPDSDLVFPSDDYLVRMPDIPSVDTATGTVTFPSDAAYTKDAVAVPYPVDTEGVKVPDIPYDKVVDQSTGKTLDDADTGTDTKPGEGTGEGTETGSGVSGLIGTIIGLLKNFFDSPSDFKLDMDGFRNLAIADKFPFCIPFDMVDSVKQFAATAADYQFRIKFDTQYFSVDHTVDLTPIAVPLAFFRYIVCVWFVWVLMSRTHDLMKW